MKVIEIRNLHKIYNDSEHEVHAIRGIDLSFEEGEFAVIAGASGCGKTTLLKHVIGLLEPISGTIRIEGVGKPGLNGGPPQFGVLFQSGALFGSMSVLENVMVGMHSRLRSGLLPAVLGTRGARGEDERSRTEAGELLALVMPDVPEWKLEARASVGIHLLDQLTDPTALARTVTTGVLDAPHLRNNPCARGQVVTRIDRRGACVAMGSVMG